MRKDILTRIKSVLPTSLTAQAENSAQTWSSSQKSRQDAYKDVRFTDVDLSTQPRPLAAIQLVNAEPIVQVHSRVVSCSGGGALGHPKIYINLDKPNAHSCMYCGKRFTQSHH